MPTIEQILLLVGAGVLANAGVIALLLLPRRAARRQVEPSSAAERTVPSPIGARDRRSEAAATGTPSPATLDRVLRVVSLLFLAAGGLAVTTSGAFKTSEAVIYFLIAAGTLAVVFVSDLIPDRMRAARQVVQVVIAILVVTALVLVSGGVSSPFVAGYFLIVGGAALSADDSAPTLLSIGASLAYVLVAALAPGVAPIGPSTIAWAAFNVVALALLAYIATVAGRQQRRARQAALRLAHFDALTGLFTRNHLFDTIEQETARSARIGRGFCLLMIDLDDLKPVNDTFGHQVGDGVLRAVTDVVRRTIRQTDIAGRYGGDEFLIVLPETDAAGALVVAEKLRADIAAMNLRVDTRTFRTSVSIGLVSYPEDGTTLETLMASVDAAMYESKRRGKNQIVGYVTLPESAGNGDTAVSPDDPPPPRPPVIRAVPGVPRKRRPDATRRAPVPTPIDSSGTGGDTSRGYRVTVADVGRGGPPDDRELHYQPPDADDDDAPPPEGASGSSAPSGS